MYRRPCIAVLVAALTAAVAACGSSGSSSASGQPGSTAPINVFMLQALSGPLASAGEANVEGAKAAVAVVNAAGGVNGRKLKLTVEDTQGTGTQALALLQTQLNSGAKPDLLIDGSANAEGLALHPLVAKDDILAVGGATGYLTVNPSVSANRTKFTVSPDVSVLHQELAAYLKAKGYHKVAVIASSDDYGKLFESGFSDDARSVGLQVTATAAFNDSALDVTPQLQALQASKPDVLVAEGYGAPEGYILTDRERLGWTGTPFVGDPTFSSDLTKLVDNGALKNVTFQAPALERYTAPAQMSPNVRAFFSALQEQAPITQPLTKYAYCYDAIIMAAAAMKKAGSTDPIEVAHALENLGPVSRAVLQPTYFTPQSHFPAPVASAYVFLTPGPLVDGMIKSQA